MSLLSWGPGQNAPASPPPPPPPLGIEPNINPKAFFYTIKVSVITVGFEGFVRNV